MNTLTKQTVYLPIKSKEVKRYSKHVIDCEECEGLIDDEQYTCTYCWSEGGNGKLHFDDLFKEQQAFVFSSEQLNEYTQTVIKQALETAAEKGKIEQKGYFEATSEECLNGIDVYDDNGSDTPSYIVFLDKESITNTFEQTFQKYKV